MVTIFHFLTMLFPISTPSVMSIKYMDSEDAAVQEVSNGKADAVIIFPQNFTQDVYTATNPTIATNSSSSGLQ